VRLLLDTNVLSEVTKPAPDSRVLEWLDQLDEDRSFISVVSIAEIRRGVALMDEGRKREALAEWLAQDLPQRFEQRVLHIDEPIALAWGDLMALAKRRGLSSMDGLIAATAVAHNLTLATRNTRDFEGFGFELLDPWTA
jgi:predicted nucleic acid-binding protein